MQQECISLCLLHFWEELQVPKLQRIQPNDRGPTMSDSVGECRGEMKLLVQCSKRLRAALIQRCRLEPRRLHSCVVPTIREEAGDLHFGILGTKVLGLCSPRRGTFFDANLVIDVDSMELYGSSWIHASGLNSRDTKRPRLGVLLVVFGNGLEADSVRPHM